MSLTIPSTTQIAPAAEAQTPAASQKPAQSQASSKASVPTDSVKISTAAQTALQEAQENQAQTVKEANHGDQQAKRLLAKEAATKKA